MKYKLLLMGSNEIAIDEFFTRMDEDFELMSTSLHFMDIKGHVKYFKPDAIVCCLNKESRETITRISTVKKDVARTSLPIIILGNRDECDEFCRMAVNVADHILVKPLTAYSISRRIISFMDEYRSGAASDNLEELNGGGIDTLLEQIGDAVPEPATSGGVGMGPGSVPVPVPVPITESEPKAEAAVEEAPQEKKRILIVDDDIRMLKVIKAHLEEDYTAATAVNGKIALRFLENKHVDLILLDYEMPEMSGPELLEKLRGSIKTSDIPVVFLTGASEKEKIVNALSLKPQGYLLKPVDKVKLMEKIEEVLG